MNVASNHAGLDVVDEGWIFVWGDVQARRRAAVAVVRHRQPVQGSISQTAMRLPWQPGPP